MLYWAMVFLVIALIAGLLGVGGFVQGMAVNIAYVLFAIFLIMFVVSLLTGTRRPPVT